MATESPSTYKPTADAYTGMLTISLIALVTGCVLLYLDFSQYPERNPAKPTPFVPFVDPKKGTPETDGAAKDTPAKDVPAKDAPVKDAPAKDAPAAKDVDMKDKEPAKDKDKEPAKDDEKKVFFQIDTPVRRTARGVPIDPASLGKANPTVVACLPPEKVVLHVV